MATSTKSNGLDTCITVVSGLPRSGTSMMMQVIASGGIPVLVDAHRPADDDNPKGYFEFAPIKRLHKDNTWVDQGLGKVMKVVTPLVPFLPENFSYRVVMMHRPVEEVLASQKAMLDRRGEKHDPSMDSKMAEVFRGEVKRVAQWLSDRPQFHVLDVSYNEFVANPEAWISRVNEFLGGALDAVAMKGAIDPKLYRQRR